MLNSIGFDLKKSIKKAGISKQIEAVTVCDVWESVICEIFGLQVADKSKAIRFKGGVLTVAVLNSVLAQEFKFKEEEIKSKINQKKAGFVKKIRFEI